MIAQTKEYRCEVNRARSLGRERSPGLPVAPFSLQQSPTATKAAPWWFLLLQAQTQPWLCRPSAWTPDGCVLIGDQRPPSASGRIWDPLPRAGAVKRNLLLELLGPDLLEFELRFGWSKFFFTALYLSREAPFLSSTAVSFFLFHYSSYKYAEMKYTLLLVVNDVLCTLYAFG